MDDLVSSFGKTLSKSMQDRQIAADALDLFKITFTETADWPG
jgi:hypothetical protein